MAMISCPYCDTLFNQSNPDYKLCSHCDDKITYPEEFIIKEINNFPKFRTFSHCGIDNIAPILQKYGNCGQCGMDVKLRGFGAENELAGLLLVARRWLEEYQILTEPTKPKI